MKQKRVGVVVGSLRRESYSRRVADCLREMMPGELEMVTLPIGDLPIFNQDFDDDGNTPKSWEALRKAVGEMDAYLFVTPEYNRSVPPVLKNALDIASRPYGANQWGGKPGAVISVSMGGIGGFGANHHLRQSLVFLDVFTMQQPEAYVSNCTKLFEADGSVSPESQAFLKSLADAFAAWVDRF